MTAQPQPPLLARLADALDLVLLFYAPGHWTPEMQQKWHAATGNQEATTKILCDHLRALLAEARSAARPSGPEFAARKRYPVVHIHHGDHCPALADGTCDCGADDDLTDTARLRIAYAEGWTAARARRATMAEPSREAISEIVRRAIAKAGGCSKIALDDLARATAALTQRAEKAERTVERFEDLNVKNSSALIRAGIRSFGYVEEGIEQLAQRCAALEADFSVLHGAASEMSSAIAGFRDAQPELVTGHLQEAFDIGVIVLNSFAAQRSSANADMGRTVSREGEQG